MGANMRAVVSVLGLFMVSALPASAEPHYLVRTINDNKNAFVVDAGSLTPQGDQVYQFTLINVFNGDAIKDGTKSRVSTLEVNCAAPSYRIVRLETFDASGASLSKAEGGNTHAPISPDTVVKSLADFVCSGANPGPDAKVGRIPDGRSPIVAVDDAYAKVTAK